VSQSTSPVAARAVADVPFVAKAGMGLAILLCLYVAMQASSAFGPGVLMASGGAFQPTATLLSPATPAFAIWAVVYTGLFGHAVRVWLPDPLAYPRRRWTMWPATMSMLLNVLWLLCALRGLLWATVPLMILLLGAVLVVLEGTRRLPAQDFSSLLLIDGMYGIYVGWLLVAAPANVAVVATTAGLDPTGPAGTALALALLISATVATLWAVRRYAGNIGIGLAWCWGVVWLVRSRTHDGPRSWPVVATAIVAAGLVAASTAVGEWPPRLVRRTGQGATLQR
jgi:hypothetical protein